MEEFENIPNDEGSAWIWCFWMYLAKIDAEEALGRWLEKLSQLKRDPEARTLKTPLLHSWWTVVILKLLAMALSKQMENNVHGTRSKKNFALWWRIEEVWIQNVEWRFLRFWKIGGKVSYEFLWIVIMISILLWLSSLYSSLITLLITN